jgi:hypothetical protein
VDVPSFMRVVRSTARPSRTGIRHGGGEQVARGISLVGVGQEQIARLAAGGRGSSGQPAVVHWGRGWPGGSVWTTTHEATSDARVRIVWSRSVRREALFVAAASGSIWAFLRGYIILETRAKVLA